MSAGSFSVSKYQSDLGDIHEIKIQPETAEMDIDSVENTAPPSAVNSVFAAEVNRGARAYGLRPRKIRVAFKASPPAGYRPYTTLTLPILQKSVFDGINNGDTVTYNGGTGEVTKKLAEDINPGSAALGQDNATPTT